MPNAVKVNRELEELKVTKEPRQGCKVAPTLLNQDPRSLKNMIYCIYIILWWWPNYEEFIKWNLQQNFNNIEYLVCANDCKNLIINGNRRDAHDNPVQVIPTRQGCII